MLLTCDKCFASWQTTHCGEIDLSLHDSAGAGHTCMCVVRFLEFFFLLQVSLFVFCFPLPESFGDPQAVFHVLVNHVADADSRNNFHEVWQDAPVKSKKAIFGYNFFQQTSHRGLVWRIQRCCREEQKRELLHQLKTCSRYLDVGLSRYFRLQYEPILISAHYGWYKSSLLVL